MDVTAVLLQLTETPAEGLTPNEGLPRPPWLPEFVPIPLYQLALAIVLVVFAYYVSKLARQLLGRRIARRFRRPSVTRTVLRSMQIAIMLVAVLTALSFLGLGVGNIALSVGVFSAVVGIILAPIIGSVLSGVFVLTEQPYEIGDMIEIEDTDTRGFVEDITLLYTKVFTLDNTFIVLPNGTMRERDIINYSAEDTRTRLTLDVDVTYESDVPAARKLLEAAARDVDSVIRGGPDIRVGSARYPAAPSCYIHEFADHGVTLRLRYWAREPYKLTTVRSNVLTNAWERLADADVEIPYPHSHLVFDDTSGEMQVAFREQTKRAAARQSGATTRSDVDGENGDDGVTGEDAAGENDSTDSDGAGATDSP